MTALELGGVSVAVDGTIIVGGVDLAVEAGEMVGLVGPNGAGKTTLLRVITGAASSTGRVRLFGSDAATMDRAVRSRAVAMVPQRPSIPLDMRVVDYVLLGRTPHLGYLATESPTDLQAVEEAIVMLDLVRLSGRVMGGLSGGELQRVVLARALAQAAPLLLLDEPTAALDVGAAQQVLDLVDEIRRRQRLTVVAAVHDLTLAAQFCDRLVMISGGSIVAEGAARTVLTESVIRQHYGASVRVLEDGAGGVVVIPVNPRTRRGDSRQHTGGATMSDVPATP